MILAYASFHWTDSNCINKVNIYVSLFGRAYPLCRNLYITIHTYSIIHRYLFIIRSQFFNIKFGTSLFTLVRHQIQYDQWSCHLHKAVQLNKKKINIIHLLVLHRPNRHENDDTVNLMSNWFRSSLFLVDLDNIIA